jgi:hypothetical protein
MTNMSIGSKSMTIGEALLAPLFLVLAFLCVIASALAHDGAFAFHTALGAIASLGAAFTIINHYYERPAQLPPAEISGRPNYNLGPVKFAAVAAMFWGIAGFWLASSSPRNWRGRRSTSICPGSVLAACGRCIRLP